MDHICYSRGRSLETLGTFFLSSQGSLSLVMFYEVLYRLRGYSGVYGPETDISV